VIRFSAALVAVAIGVLVGGIAASELLLVYIAIAMSAVALAVLITGVVLKREELFGEGQGLAPAGAGVSPGLSAHAGESYGQSLHGVQETQSPRVTPPPLQGAAGPGAAFAGNAPVASPRPEADLAAARPAPASPERPPGQSSSWETKSTRDEWTSPAPDTHPANGADGRGSAPPSWFDRPDWSSADVPVATPTSAAMSGWSWSARDAGDTAAPEGKSTPGDTAASAGATLSADEDDDWPTRYSWLDDEPEESAPVGNGADDTGGTQAAFVGAAQENAEPQSGSVVPVGSGEAAADDRRSRLSVVADAIPAADASGDTETPAAATGLDAAAEDAAPESDDPSASAADAAADTGLVTVIPGVPRYHDPDCVLIRFMPEGDNQKLSVAQAREAGCTPCTVCQHEEHEE
jgi:hypothetical protein